MKKVLVSLSVVLLIVLGLTGCAESSPLADAGFEEVSEGTYTMTDTSADALPEGGLKIDIVTGDTGYVKFTVTDNDGTETVDFYQFNPATSEMHRHRYVAAMGNTYNYYLDYAKMELTTVTDADGEDVSMGLQMSGRWDSSETETIENVESLMAYFEEKCDLTIDEAVDQ